MGFEGDANPAVSKLWFRIGEVARIAEVEPSVLRHWESEFRLLRPRRSRSGQRLYHQRDVRNVLEIKRLLYEQGFTIKGAVKHLREKGVEPREEQDPMVIETERLRSLLLDVRDEIGEMLAALGAPEDS